MLRGRLRQTIHYQLLRASDALSRLMHSAAFLRMPDALARRQQRVDDLIYRLQQAQSRRLANLRRRLEDLDSRLRHHDMRGRLGVIRRQLDQRSSDLRAQGQRLLAAKRAPAEQLSAALSRATETVLLRKRSRWERLQGSLTALSPKAILARGYALVFDGKGELVKEAARLKAGDSVRTQLGSGEFTATVKAVKATSATE